MHTQMFWFKHGFLAWTQRKGLYFARLEVTLKKKHTLILKRFYCSLKKTWTGLMLVSSGDGSCSD